MTAVEWLADNLDLKLDFSESKRIIKLFEQAKEMEKQQQGYSEEDLEYAFEQGKLTSNVCYRRTFKNLLEIIKIKKK